MGPTWDPSGQPAYGLTHMGHMRNPVAPIYACYLGICNVNAQLFKEQNKRTNDGF